jgi:hypothetical protein
MLKAPPTVEAAFSEHVDKIKQNSILMDKILL